jgi:hypothetical protein
MDGVLLALFTFVLGLDGVLRCLLVFNFYESEVFHCMVKWQEGRAS